MNQISTHTKKNFQTNIPLGKYLKIISYLFFTFNLFAQPTSSEMFVSNNKNLERILIKKSHQKPVITVIGENQFTELTDFIIPYGILKRANIGEIFALAPNKGIMNFFPALSMEIKTSFSDFDHIHPEGSDIVIVPAIHNSENKTIIQWIQSQSQKGATIVGICDGVWTVGHAGLLENKKATGHWYSKEGLNKSFPNTKWIQNKRYIQDQNIITTTGVSASLPISISLIEVLANETKAKLMAEEIGFTNWSSHHKTEGFQFSSVHYITAAKNLIFVWNHETIGISIYEGIDEVSLALVADSYSRTYKSKAFAISNQPIQTKSGLVLIPEMQVTDNSKIDYYTEIPKDKKPYDLFLNALHDIQYRYGINTYQFVTNQLEFSL
ncbi:MAG: DJ-1/PfpI family protein [Leptospira bouyouniensis]